MPKKSTKSLTSEQARQFSQLLGQLASGSGLTPQDVPEKYGGVVNQYGREGMTAKRKVLAKDPVFEGASMVRTMESMKANPSINPKGLGKAKAGRKAGSRAGSKARAGSEARAGSFDSGTGFDGMLDYSNRKNTIGAGNVRAGAFDSGTGFDGALQHSRQKTLYGGPKGTHFRCSDTFDPASDSSVKEVNGGIGPLAAVVAPALIGSIATPIVSGLVGKLFGSAHPDNDNPNNLPSQEVTSQSHPVRLNTKFTEAGGMMTSTSTYGSACPTSYGNAPKLSTGKKYTRTYADSELTEGQGMCHCRSDPCGCGGALMKGKSTSKQWGKDFAGLGERGGYIKQDPRVKSQKAREKAKSNPWIQHLQQFRSQHPELSYKEAMQKAKASYHG